MTSRPATRTEDVTAPSEPPVNALDLPDHPEARVPAALQRLRAQLGARDITVLRDIAALRLVTARQVERLRFREGSALTQARRARRTLARLHDHGLLARLDRRIGGHDSGSAAHVYRLTPKGRGLLGLPGPHGGRRRHLDQPSRHHATHVLAVTELAVRLHEAHRAGDLELVRFQAEPASWRTWTDLSGVPHQLRPDAFVIVATGEWEWLWFVEVDLGTEHLPVLRHKAAAYRQYARAGVEQQHHGVFPRVAYLTDTPARRDALARTLHATPDAEASTTVALLSDAPAALVSPTPDDTEQPT